MPSRGVQSGERRASTDGSLPRNGSVAFDLAPLSAPAPQQPQSSSSRTNSDTPSDTAASSARQSAAAAAPTDTAQLSRNGNNWLGPPDDPLVAPSVAAQFMSNFTAAQRHREYTDFEISRLKEQAAGLRGIIETLDPPERQVRRTKARGGFTLKDEFSIKVFSQELTPFATRKVRIVGEADPTRIPGEGGAGDDAASSGDEVDSADLLRDDASFDSSSATRSQPQSSSYASSSTGDAHGPYGGKSAILKDKQARDRQRFEGDPQLQFEFATRHIQSGGANRTRVQRTLAAYYFMQKDTRRLRRKMKELEREAAMDQSRVPLFQRPLSAPMSRPAQPHRQCFPVRPLSAMPGRHPATAGASRSAVAAGDGVDGDSSSDVSSDGDENTTNPADAVADAAAKRKQKLQLEARAALFGPAKVLLAPQTKADYARILQQQQTMLGDLRRADKDYAGMVNGLEQNTKRLHGVLEGIVAQMDRQVKHDAAAARPAGRLRQ